MPTAARFAHGTLLKIGDGGGGEIFTTIAEVKSISGPSIGRDTIEVTSHDSTGSWREFIAGLKDGGEITFEVNWIASHATQSYSAGLLKDLDSGTRRNFQIVFPFAAPVTWTIPALVTRFEPASPIDGALTASVTLKVAGQPTLT